MRKNKNKHMNGHETGSRITRRGTALAIALILTQQQFLTSLVLAEEPDLSLGYAYEEEYIPADFEATQEVGADLSEDSALEVSGEAGDLYIDDPFWQEDEFTIDFPGGDGVPIETPEIILDDLPDAEEYIYFEEDTNPSAGGQEEAEPSSDEEDTEEETASGEAE